MKKIFYISIACLFLIACDNRKEELEKASVNRLVVIINKTKIGEPSDYIGFETKDFTLINSLQSVIVNSEPDSGLYDTAKTITILLYNNDKCKFMMSVGGSLFDFNGQQYKDKSEKLGKIIEKICTESNKISIEQENHFLNLLITEVKKLKEKNK